MTKWSVSRVFFSICLEACVALIVAEKRANNEICINSIFDGSFFDFNLVCGDIFDELNSFTVKIHDEREPRVANPNGNNESVEVDMHRTRAYSVFLGLKR